MPTRHLIVVPHTHWDREWHRTHEQFRHRLVRLVDRLLAILEGDPGFRHFTLDGQAIVLEDYLEVRPGQRERVEKLVRDGRLRVGPWYVLPDEWLVSGEALVRNLRLGLRLSEQAGGAMRLGYAPDLFGHVGQLPQIFAGFGFPAACLWRGVPEAVDRTVFDWEAPDGTCLPTVYLRHGYGNAVHLPLEPGRLRRRLEGAAAALADATAIPTLLLMNGSDHVEPQPGLPAALDAALAGHPELTAEIGTLEHFLERALPESEGRRPRHRGELRSGLRAPLLPGCASSRMAQKRADFRNDVLLTRYVEPLAAWLSHLGGDPGLDVIEHAWRVALQNHPHDSICGCSVDEVHREIDVRLARVGQIAGAHLGEVAGLFSQHVQAPPGDGVPLVVWNPHGGGTACVDSELELPVAVRGREGVHLRAADGRAIPASLERLAAPGALMDLTLPASAARGLVSGVPSDFAGAAIRSATWHGDGARLDVELCVAEGPSPFDLAGAKEELRALLASGRFETVRLVARPAPRVRLRFTDALPGHGLRTYRLCTGPAERAAAGEDAPRAERRPDGGVEIANEHLRLRVHGDGRCDLLAADGATLAPDLLRLCDEGDRGDEYDFDPVPGGERVERPDRVEVRAWAGEAEAVVSLALRYRVPLCLASDRRERSRRRVVLPVDLTLRLARGLARLEVEVALDNRARDHRLRLRVRAPFAARRFLVESAFELAERPIDPPRDAFGSGRPSELPFGSVPQRACAALVDGSRALVVANRGGGEVEAVPEDDGSTSLALTLLRAVGWLSRGDLTMRPGDAGPPLPTPEAQVPGRHELAFAVALAPADPAGLLAFGQAFAAPPLAIWGGARAGILGDGARLLTLDDPAALVSAIEPRPDGRLLVRLWNASSEAREVAVGLPGEPEQVDLAERPLGDAGLRRTGTGSRLSLRPSEIANLRF